MVLAMGLAKAVSIVMDITLATTHRSRGLAAPQQERVLASDPNMAQLRFTPEAARRRCGAQQ